MLRGADVTSAYKPENFHVDAPEDASLVAPSPGTTGVPSSSSSIINTNSTQTMMRLYELAKPERGWILLAAISLAFSSAVQLTTPYLSGYVIDLALRQQKQQGNDSTAASPIPLLIVLGGLVGLSQYLTFLRHVWLAKTSQCVVARLRRALYAAILAQDAAFFDKTKTGDLLSRLSTDADLVQTAVQESVLGVLRNVAMALGAAGMLLWTSWSLALVALAILPPSMTIARTVGRKMRERHVRVRELHAEAMATAEQALMGILTVQQFVAESHEAEKYNASIHFAHYQAIETARVQARFNAMVQVIGNGSMLAVLGYGGYQVAIGRLSAGAMASFVIYALMMAGNVSSLSNIWLDLMKAAAGANRVFEIMDRTPTIQPAPQVLVDTNASNNTLSSPHYHFAGKQPPLSQQVDRINNTSTRPLSIEFRNVSFYYPERPESRVLGPNFDLSIRAGEVIALVGGSGAGKSTVASLLTRLYDVTEGAIYIDGINMMQMTPQKVRENVGIVSQEPLLFPTSIADNIRYGKLDASDNQVREAAQLANVLEFSNGFPKGLDTVVGPRGGTQLSGGQKQRVAVARAILKDPPIVIFDESTSALDSESENKVQKAIDIAMKGRTVIVIAHRLSTIRRAQRIALIQGGQVAEIGSFEELVSKPKGPFRELMKRQLIVE